MTLDEAIKNAIEKNISLMAQRLDVPIAEAKIITARIKPNPHLSFASDYMDLLGRGVTVQNNAGPSEFSVRTDYTLEGGRKRERRVEVAELTTSVAKLTLSDAVRNLMLDVENAFVDVQAAKESVALAKQNQDALNAIVTVNENRARAGDLAQVEVTRSRLAALQFSNAVKQAELRLTTAGNRLQQLIGSTTTDNRMDVAGPIREDKQLILLDEIRTQALANRPDLLALRRNRERSEADIRLQKATGKIDYTVGVAYQHQYTYSNGRLFGAYLSIPLPVYDRNQGEVARAEAEHKQADLRIQAQERAIATEAENAYRQWETSRSLVENIERDMLQQARSVREITEYSYRRGEASLVEFLDAQRAFNETMQSYNEARADYARSLYLIEAVSAKVVQP
ncbi:MAG: TolC family protein [Bryobacteraceae bacterium]